MSAARTAALFLVGLGAALAGGWYSAAPIEVDEASLIVPARGAGAGAGLDKPNAAFGQAAAALDQLGLAEPVQIANVPAEAAVEEPSITAELRRDITAVLPERNGRVLLVIDRENGDQRVRLRTGDTFRRGWKIKQITAQRVVLVREGVEQIMPIMSTDHAEPDAPADGQAEQPVEPG